MWKYRRECVHVFLSGVLRPEEIGDTIYDM